MTPHASAGRHRHHRLPLPPFEPLRFLRRRNWRVPLFSVGKNSENIKPVSGNGSAIRSVSVQNVQTVDF